MLLQEGDRAQEARPRGYRQQREAEQRANAGNRVAWNTLFMRPDTVAEAVAAHYGVSKSQLLDRDAAGEHLLDLRCHAPRGCMGALANECRREFPKSWEKKEAFSAFRSAVEQGLSTPCRSQESGALPF